MEEINKKVIARLLSKDAEKVQAAMKAIWILVNQCLSDGTDPVRIMQREFFKLDWEFIRTDPDDIDMMTKANEVIQNARFAWRFPSGELFAKKSKSDFAGFVCTCNYHEQELTGVIASAHFYMRTNDQIIVQAQPMLLAA